MVESSVQSTLISDGYAAFNKGDFATVRELFCDDTEENGEVFPLWEKMDHEGPIRGRTAIIDYLTGLREDGVKAKLLAVADHGH
ncbi:MAG TPA: nuclear transport factor 2 family protein, partial [Acidimicrobiia bacterium]